MDRGEDPVTRLGDRHDSGAEYPDTAHVAPAFSWNPTFEQPEALGAACGRSPPRSIPDAAAEPERTDNK
jgi:hypothetical protein